MSRCAATLVLLATLALSGCEGRSAEAGSSTRVRLDTLANGAIHVRNSGPGAWEAAGLAPWRVEEDLRIGVVDGEEPYMFGAARNVLPSADGGVWVLDSQAFELRLFDGSSSRSPRTTSTASTATTSGVSYVVRLAIRRPT